MPLTVKWNQDFNAGQTWITDFTLLNPNGTPRSVIGNTFQSSLKRHYKSVNATTILVEVLDASTGNIKLSLTDTQTTALIGGKYLYDVEMTDTEGIKERIIQGVITVRPEVTK